MSQILSSAESIIVQPSVSPAQASIVWLHGLGADGNDFVPLVSELKLPEALGIRFVFPHAPFRPVTINNGYVMRAWYDLFSWQLDQRIDEKGIYESIRLLEQFIKQEEQAGISSKKIILAGFSQGAVIALMAGLCTATPLGGIIALSGYFPHAELILKQANPVNQAIPIFLAHGEQDTVVPYHLSGLAIQSLSQHGYPVEGHSYPMAHSVCLEEIQDIRKWLKNIFQK